MSSDNLITRYRPSSWKDVVGQAPIVKALQGICERRDAQTFLFAGPSGCGKTTLARLVSYEMGVEEKNVLEIDAATFTGIDSMRQIQDMLPYRPFGSSGKRALIIDEAHALSRQAWDSLLKIVEEPPEHVIWCFCTTNIGKVPKTIKTRCATFELAAVPEKVLGKFYDDICELEKIDLPGDVGDLIIRESQGSPRQLLANLSVCREAADKKEAAQLLQTAVESDATIELCRFLANSNGSWSKCMSILGKLEDQNAEGIRILAANYFGKCLKDSKTDNDACFFMQRLEAFSIPYNSAEGMAPLLLSIGRVMFAE